MFLIPEPGNGGTKYTGKPADQGVGAILDSRVDSSETIPRVATRRSYFTVTSSHKYQESKENISSKSSFCG